MRTIRHIIHTISVYAICLVFFGMASKSYFSPFEVFMVLIFAILQGISATIIDHFVEIWILRYFVQGIKVYLLTLLLFLVNHWQIYMIRMTIFCFIIFTIVYIYNNFVDRKQVSELNERIKNMKK